MENALSDRSNDFFIKSTFKRYLFPSILSILGYTLSLLINSIIVGNVIGEHGLAAMSIVNPIYFIFATMGSLINVGGAVGASILIGKADLKGCNNLFTLSLVFSLISGIFLSIVGMLFLKPMILLFGGEGELYPLAYNYARVMVPGGISVILLYFPFNFLRIDGRPHLSVVMFFFMAPINILLDLYFMVSKGMGMYGLALATVISTLAATVLGFIFLFSKKGTFKLVKPEAIGASVKDIAHLGSAMALNNVYNIFRTIIINRLLFAAFGKSAIMIFALLATINNFSQAIISGVSQTITPLIGVFFGEKDNTSIRQTLKLAMITGTVLISILALLLSVLSRQIVVLFGITQENMVEKVSMALILFCISLVFAMVNSIFIFHFFTTRRTAIANILTSARAFVFVILTVGIFSILKFEDVVWLGFLLAEIATLLLLFLIVRKVSNKKTYLSKVYLLDQTYEQDGRYISFSIANDVHEIVDASIRISAFCEENDLSPKLSMMISLSLEEMLLSISEHSFKKEEKSYIDIRIFVHTDMVVLRMRNNGLLYDPIAYYEKKMADNDGQILDDDSIGIGLIVKNAEEVSFNRTFGVNNLTIQLYR